MVALRPIDPNETLDYALDWSDFLDDAGSPSDTISISTWEIYPSDGSPAGPTLSGELQNSNSTCVFLSGCVHGSVYLLTNRVVTTVGRTADRSITIRCQTR
jgi:hypothetical protein